MYYSRTLFLCLIIIHVTEFNPIRRHFSLFFITALGDFLQEMLKITQFREAFVGH